MTKLRIENNSWYIVKLQGFPPEPAQVHGLFPRNGKPTLLWVEFQDDDAPLYHTPQQFAKIAISGPHTLEEITQWKEENRC